MLRGANAWRRAAAVRPGGVSAKKGPDLTQILAPAKHEQRNPLLSLLRGADEQTRNEFERARNDRAPPAPGWIRPE